MPARPLSTRHRPGASSVSTSAVIPATPGPQPSCRRSRRCHAIANGSATTGGGGSIATSLGERPHASPPDFTFTGEANQEPSLRLLERWVVECA